MIIPTHFGPAIPVLRAQVWSAQAFGRLVSLDLMAVDLRFALASVVARSLTQAADALVRHVMGRAWREPVSQKISRLLPPWWQQPVTRFRQTAGSGELA